MNKFFALLLSQLILFQSVHFCWEDVVKIENLFEHAKFHKEQYGDSFLEFLVEHYVEGFDAVTHNHEEHQDLPFKQDSNKAHQLTIVFAFKSEVIQLETKTPLREKSVFFYQEGVSESAYSIVLQPPKNA